MIRPAVGGTASRANRCAAVFIHHYYVVLASGESQQIPINTADAAELGAAADVDLSSLYCHQFGKYQLGVQELSKWRLFYTSFKRKKSCKWFRIRNSPRNLGFLLITRAL